MRKLLVFLILMQIPPALSATQVKVNKIKGTKALVEFEGPLQEGQTYVISTQSNTQEVEIRRFRLGVSADMTSLRSKSDASTEDSSAFNLGFDFGWNWGESEAGFILGYRNSKTDLFGTSSTLTLGGFYDYNFTPNVSPETSIFGWGTRFTLASISEGGSEALNRTGVYLNLFWKWFVTPHGALRGDLGYYYDNGKVSSNNNSTITGPKASLGLALYF